MLVYYSRKYAREEREKENEYAGRRKRENFRKPEDGRNFNLKNRGNVYVQRRGNDK